MDFGLDDKQRELQDAVRRFCAARFGQEDLVRRDCQPIDRSTWRAMAELGVFALFVPTARGGLGLGAVEGAIVFEQLGAHLVTGPVLWTAIAASWVDGAQVGERLVGGVDLPHASVDPIVVEHAAEIDALLVVRGDGVFLLAESTLPAWSALAPLDPHTPVGGTSAVPRGARVGDTHDASRLRLLGTVLSAAMLLGIADAALESSRRWALERRQFGVPIGSFQAIQHLLADMYVRSVLARSATYAAAATLDDPEVGDAARAVSVAKLLAGEAAVENARTAIQIHGGMGFTWEMPPGYLLKRAWALEHLFGDAETHALSLAAAVEETPA